MTSLDMTVLPPTALEDIERAAAEAVLESSEALQAEAAQMLARYGLGDSALAASLTVEVDEAGETLVVAEADYARFVEFGTHSEPARPFLGAALESLRMPLTTLITGRIAAALAALGRKI